MSPDPASLDLEQARRRAKELLKAARAGEPGAVDRLARTDRPPQLADAQHVVAVELGYATWPALVAAVRAHQQDALYHAAESDDPSELDRLVARGAEIAGSHALFRALDFDDPARVGRLLAAGADPNERYPGEPDVRGDTPLHHAVLRGRNVATIDALVDAGADVDAADGGGLTPFRMAVRLGNNTVADRLLEHGARDDLTDTDRFLFACAHALGDDGAEARQLLPSATIVDRDRFVPLTAVRRNDASSIATLLELGAFDVGVRDSHLRGTLLHWAAWFGYAALTRLLLERGADPAALAEHGTPLDWARHGATDPEAARSDYAVRVGADPAAVIALLGG